MANLLGITVEELVARLVEKHARMPFEIGAFVALETAEALRRGLAKVGAADVRIGEDGSVSIFAPPNSASDADAAQSVVDLLTALLVAAGHGVPPAFLDIVEQPPAARGWDLARLRDELEASLIPLNRQASRRVLSRLLREATREGSVHSGPISDPPPDIGAVDAELDAMLAGDAPVAVAASAGTGTEPGGVLAPTATHGAGPRQASREISTTEELDRLLETPAFGVESPAPMKVAAQAVRNFGGVSDFPAKQVPLHTPVLPKPSADDVRAREEALLASPALAPAKVPAAVSPPHREPDVAGMHERREPARVDSRRPSGSPREIDFAAMDGEGDRKGGAKWLLIFGVAIAVLVGGVYMVRRDAVLRLLGQPVPEAPAAAALPKPKAPEIPAGDLQVRVAPAEAQVLLLVGDGPAVAPNLPVGVAMEFIAIADGKVPTRAVVPANAEWTDTPEGPRYELAMQAGDAPMAFDDLVLGDTKLPRDAMGAPNGRLGSIRVLTNPPKASVYMLIGFGPTATVQSLRADKEYDLLVYAKGFVPQRVHVGTAAWTALDGKRVAEVDVTLNAAR